MSTDGFGRSFFHRWWSWIHRQPLHRPSAARRGSSGGYAVRQLHIGAVVEHQGSFRRPAIARRRHDRSRPSDCGEHTAVHGRAPGTAGAMFKCFGAAHSLEGAVCWQMKHNRCSRRRNIGETRPRHGRVRSDAMVPATARWPRICGTQTSRARDVSPSTAPAHAPASR